MVIIGGASEVLDDALKDFIVEWLVPVLVEEYIRLHHKVPMSDEALVQGVELTSQEPVLSVSV